MMELYHGLFLKFLPWSWAAKRNNGGSYHRPNRFKMTLWPVKIGCDWRQRRQKSLGRRNHSTVKQLEIEPRGEMTQWGWQDFLGNTAVAERLRNNAPKFNMNQIGNDLENPAVVILTSKGNIKDRQLVKRHKSSQGDKSCRKWSLQSRHSYTKEGPTQHYGVYFRVHKHRISL